MATQILHRLSMYMLFKLNSWVFTYCTTSSTTWYLITLITLMFFSYMGSSYENCIISIFMQYVPGGSLAHIIAKFGPLEEQVSSLYTRQILEALQYLHANNVVHRSEISHHSWWILIWIVVQMYSYLKTKQRVSYIISTIFIYTSMHC